MGSTPTRKFRRTPEVFAWLETLLARADAVSYGRLWSGRVRNMFSSLADGEGHLLAV